MIPWSDIKDLQQVQAVVSETPKVELQESK